MGGGEGYLYWNGEGGIQGLSNGLGRSLLNTIIFHTTATKINKIHFIWIRNNISSYFIRLHIFFLYITFFDIRSFICDLKQKQIVIL